jgi:hypothetical protein
LTTETMKPSMTEESRKKTSTMEFLYIEDTEQ